MNQITAAKNFVVRNRFKIVTTIAVVATTVAVVEQIGIRSLNQLIESKGLTNEYYPLED